MNLQLTCQSHLLPMVWVQSGLMQTAPCLEATLTLSAEISPLNHTVFVPEVSGQGGWGRHLASELSSTHLVGSTSCVLLQSVIE